MVPVVDLLNHGGEEAGMLLNDKSQDTDNVEWQLGEAQDNGGQCMLVSWLVF